MTVPNENISFMQSLCMGRIEEDLVVPFPKLSEEEREMVSDVVSAMDGMLGHRGEDFRKWDVTGEFPKGLLQELKEFGFFGLVVPEEFGGMGQGAMGYSRTLQQVARHDASIAVTVGAHCSIGMRGLTLFGTPEQKKRYMPKLATGELVAAYCLTEAGAGSDAAAIRTKAVRDGDDWILNGNKLWITNGGIADFFTVFAKTDDGSGKGKMTAFIVTNDMKGVSAGPHEDKMGIRASSTTTVHFDDVRVPQANVLGEVGEGFKVAMRILNSGRTGLGGGCVGAMKHLVALATAQSNERTTFGKPISEYGLIKEKVGQMMVDCYTSESVVTMVAGLVDAGCTEYAIEAAISKVYASECLWRTVDDALQIAGGNGYMREYPYERIMRDARINRIFEGTNEILRLYIALTAMNDVASQLRELQSTMKGIFNDPIKGFGVLSDYAKKQAAIRMKVGDVAQFTRLDIALRRPRVIFEEMTRALATAVDRILRKHGKGIIGKQFASKRLSEIMIDLFVLAATLSRVQSSIEDVGVEAAQDEIDIVEVFAHQAQARIKRNLKSIDDNVDETLKGIADAAFKAEKYPWDTI